jgi:hypothetical protein
MYPYVFQEVSSDFPTKTLCAFHLSRTCYMCRILVDFVVLIIGEEYKLWSSLMITALDSNIAEGSNTGGLTAWMYGETVTGHPKTNPGQLSVVRDSNPLSEYACEPERWPRHDMFVNNRGTSSWIMAMLVRMRAAVHPEWHSWWRR